LNVGQFAVPRIAPDIGSMTMMEMAEARVFSAAARSSCSTMNWIELSIVVVRFAPT
jgi:hypothetical protein